MGLYAGYRNGAPARGEGTRRSYEAVARNLQGFAPSGSVGVGADGGAERCGTVGAADAEGSVRRGTVPANTTVNWPKSPSATVGLKACNRCQTPQLDKQTSSFSGFPLSDHDESQARRC